MSSLLLHSATTALSFHLVFGLFCPCQLQLQLSVRSFHAYLCFPKRIFTHNFLYPTFSVHALHTSIIFFSLFVFEFFFLTTLGHGQHNYIIVPANFSLFSIISCLSVQHSYLIPIPLTATLSCHILYDTATSLFSSRLNPYSLLSKLSSQLLLHCSSPPPSPLSL